MVRTAAYGHDHRHGRAGVLRGLLRHLEVLAVDYGRPLAEALSTDFGFVAGHTAHGGLRPHAALVVKALPLRAGCFSSFRRAVFLQLVEKRFETDA